jgi:hypothetical protein
MPGFSVERTPKKPTTTYYKSVLPSRVAFVNYQTVAANERITQVKPFTSSANEEYMLKTLPSFSAQSNSLMDAPEKQYAAFTENRYYHPKDSALQALANKTCKQAKVSQHLGILSLVGLLFSCGLWAIVVVLHNINVSWATMALANGMVIGGAIAAGILAILAIIFAIAAFHRIHQEQGKYTGTNKAIGAIIFAIIVFGILALLGANTLQ